MQGKITLIVALGTVCGWFSIAVYSQQVVDATVPVKNLHWSTQGGSGGSAGQRIPLLVTVRAIGVPDTTGKAKIEFVLTNTGENDLKIPVSPQPAELEPTDPNTDYTVTHLGLFITEANRAKVLKGTADLYGKPNTALSLINLPRGHYIRVQANVWFPHISEAEKSTLSFKVGAIEDYELFRNRDGRRVLDSQEIGSSFSKEFTIQSLFFAPDSDVGTVQTQPR
jgi:hypothetical protein